MMVVVIFTMIVMGSRMEKVYGKITKMATVSVPVMMAYFMIVMVSVW